MNGFSNGLQFVPVNGAVYRIFSPHKPNKAWTLTQNNTVEITDYTGKDTQKFTIFQNGTKVAFVNKSNNQGLFVDGHGQGDSVRIKSDPGQHASSWFQVVPATNGKFANKAFIIKTFVPNKAVDLQGGVNGTNVQQYTDNKGEAQVFLILPADQIYTPNNAPQVPAVFVPVSGTQYKIINFEQPTKCLSVDKNTKNLNYAAYTGEPNQKFVIFQNGTKFAFVDQFTKQGLYVENNRNDKSARIKADPGQHPSSWVEIVKTGSGQYINVSYMIKTLSGNFYDVSGGVATGTFIHQWEPNYFASQTFLIVPADQANQNQGFNNQNQGFNNQNQNQGFNNHNQNQGFNNQGSNHQNQGFHVPNMGNLIGSWKH